MNLKSFWNKERTKRELFYYGDLDTLDGNLYTIKDIEKDMDPSWFEDGGVSTVYEFEEGEIEEEEEVKTREGYEVTVWDSRDDVCHYGIFDTEKEAVYRAEGVLDEMKREHRECNSCFIYFNRRRGRGGRRMKTSMEYAREHTVLINIKKAGI